MTRWLQAAQQAKAPMTKLTKPTKPHQHYRNDGHLSVEPVPSSPFTHSSSNARHRIEKVSLARGPKRADAWSQEDWQAFFNERAGIAEYEGGQDRRTAEASAMECCIVEWLNRHPEPSGSDRCA